MQQCNFERIYGKCNLSVHVKCNKQKKTANYNVCIVADPNLHIIDQCEMKKSEIEIPKKNGVKATQNSVVKVWNKKIS